MPMRILLLGLLLTASLAQAQKPPSPGPSAAPAAKPAPAFAKPAPTASPNAGPTSSGPALVTIKDDSLPFSVGLPHDWLSLNLKDGMGGVSIASQKQTPYSMIRLLYLPKQGRSVDLHGEFDNFEAALKAAGVSVQKQSEAELNCGGVAGIVRQYTLTSKAGKLNMKVWFGNGSRNFYSFQLTSPPGRYSTDSATFDRVLGSVDF